MTVLRGITWGHTRGAAPLQALSHVWSDQHGGLPVKWDVRSLRSFAEDSLDHFIDDYDLIVFDYPFSGDALECGWLMPMEQLLGEAQLASRQKGCVGRAYDSFVWNGRLAALPIDAATQVCVWRQDIIENEGYALPENLADTLSFARTSNAAIMPMTPTAVWGAVITICAHGGNPPMVSSDEAMPRALALQGLDWLRAMADILPDWCRAASPVAVLNRLSGTNDFAFCPLTYGYSNYAMAGYARHRLRFGNIRLGAGSLAGAILGGAGIGVSSRSLRPKEAAEYAEWLTSDIVQSTLYGQFGGQPSASLAWGSPLQNALSNNFYNNVRGSIDNCYHRPNRPGFHAFQTKSAAAMHAWVHGDTVTHAGVMLDGIDSDWFSLCKP